MAPALDFPTMRRAAVLTTLFILITPTGMSSQDRPKRKLACKTPENSKSCYWTRGRLTWGNGTPAVRLWKIGTRRVLGIYSGPSGLRSDMDNEEPDLPQNLRRKFKPGDAPIFGEFEVCPLEEEKPGQMQEACIESAKNISTGK